MASQPTPANVEIQVVFRTEATGYISHLHRQCCAAFLAPWFGGGQVIYPQPVTFFEFT